MAVAALVILMSGCGAENMLQRKTGGVEGSGASGGIDRAREMLQAQRTAESIRIYEELIAAGGPQREEALYGLALARLHADPGMRSTDRAREALQTLLTDYPQSSRRVEAEVLIGLIEETGREDSQTARLEKALDSKERELEAVREELAKREEALRNLREALLNR